MMAVTSENSQRGLEENVNVNVDQPEAKRGAKLLHKLPLHALIIGGLVMLLISVVALGTILLMKHETTATSEAIKDKQPTTINIINSKPTATSEAIAPIDRDKQPTTINIINSQSTTSLPTTYPIDPNVTVALADQLYIVPRREWLAKPPTGKQTPLQLPVPYVFIFDSEQENCSDVASCGVLVRQIQSLHMDTQGWDDIGYSFLVGGDGNAYEGRGWKNVGAQVYNYNRKCIGMVFIGTFEDVMPPERQITATKQLIEIGLKEGYIAKHYKLLAFRQLRTNNPGLLLYEEVKKWPHWSQEP